MLRSFSFNRRTPACCCIGSSRLFGPSAWSRCRREAVQLEKPVGASSDHPQEHLATQMPRRFRRSVTWAGRGSCLLIREDDSQEAGPSHLGCLHVLEAAFSPWNRRWKSLRYPNVYASESNCLVILRNWKVKPGQRVVLRPLESRYQL